MLIKREWATPVVMGAFTLSAVTGVVLFFGLFKSQTILSFHQWLGLTFVIGGLSHITVNFPAYKRHLKQPLGLTITLIYVALTITAFLPLAPNRPADNPLTKILNAVQKAPLNVLAPVLKATPEALMVRLQSAGYRIESADQSIADVASQDAQRMRAVTVVVGNRKGPPQPPAP